MVRKRPAAKNLQQILYFQGGANDGGRLEVFKAEPVPLHPRIAWKSHGLCGVLGQGPPAVIHHLYTLQRESQEDGVPVGHYVHAGWELA